MTPRLTVGMATYDDFDGVYFTIQSLRLNTPPELLSQIELVVVDNHPHNTQGPPSKETAHSLELQRYLGWVYGSSHAAPELKGPKSRHAVQGLKYVPLPNVVGTSAPRNKVFSVAAAEFVLVMDCHVLLIPEAIPSLFKWMDANPKSNDLFSGPIVYDGLETISTHFDFVWRDEMWGIWSTAWQCPHCSAVLSVRSSIPQEGGTSVVEFWSMEGLDAVNYADLGNLCQRCGNLLPVNLAWPGHEKALTDLGFKVRGLDPKDEPFEIPAQGLGLFGCRKEAWLGFNSMFRGFGGEECYIHEKYRREGRKTLCLPFLQWNHRFQRPNGTPFSHSVWDKARNYVIGLTELGMSLDPIREMFVDTNKMPKHEWELLTATPSNPPVLPTKQNKVTPPTGNWTAPKANLDEWFEWLKGEDHDYKGHEDLLKRLATDSVMVLELGGNRGTSTLCLLAGQPHTLIVVDPKVGYEWNELVRYRGTTRLGLMPKRSLDISPLKDPVDLLLIDTLYNGKQLKDELTKFYSHVAKRILIHGTTAYKLQGENGSGMCWAIRDFIEAQPTNVENPWFVAANYTSGIGLVLLSRVPSDKPETAPEPVWPVTGGPGSELKAIMASMGVNPNSNCDCNKKAEQMDLWGVEGCKAHRETIITWLKEGHTRWGWRDRLTAAAKAVTTGLAFRLNPLDPFPSLVDEAIRRAETKLSK